MLKKLTSQEIFLIAAAIITLLFMYSTILISASSEKYEDNGERFASVEVEQEQLTQRTTFVYVDQDIDE